MFICQKNKRLKRRHTMKQTLEDLYEQLMKESTSLYDVRKQEPDVDRFKSILHPDYSDYTTSTITGNIC